MFNPCSANASAFLKQYERTSAANGWDNSLRMAYFESFLEGAAELWIQRYKENELNMNKTWEDLKEDFLEEYGIRESKRALEKRLYDRKQKPNESVRSYYFDLQAIYMEYDQNGNAEDFRKYFENGLNQNLYTSYRLILDEDIDWKKFKTIIAKLDDISTVIPATDTTTQRPNQHPPGEIPPCGHCCSHRYWQSYDTTRSPRNAYHTNFNSRPSYQNTQTPFTQRFRNSENRPEGQDERGYRYGNSRTTQPMGMVPNTRTADGRPRCYNCNRVGHFAAACRQQNYGYPNAGGRRQ